MTTIEDLRTKATLIFNAVLAGENTAKRVGGAFNDTADLIEQLQKYTGGEGRFISKDKKDETKEVVTFLKGIGIGKLFDIDGDGNARLNSVTLAKFLRSANFNPSEQEGFGITQREDGKYHLSVTDLTIWGKGLFNELDVAKDKLKVGGEKVLTMTDLASSVSFWGQKIHDGKVDGPLTIGDIKISYDEKNGALALTRVSGSDKKANLYATGGLTAFGAGAVQGGGSGTSYERLDRWSDYTTAKAAAVLSAFLGNDLNERLKKVEGGALTSVDWSIIKNKPTSMPASDVPAWAKAATKPSYAWSEITGKPNEFNPSAHSHTFASLTGKPNTLQGYGITDAASISHTHAFLQLKDKPTTLQGYGITDAKIVGGTITLGTGTITPLTVHQAIYALTLQRNGVAVGSFNPKSANATLNITVPTKLSQLTDDIVSGKYLSLNGGTMQNTNIVKNLNAELLGDVKLMSAGASRGIMQAWDRGHFNDLNNYFGNGNVVVCDPQAANGLSPNDIIFSLGDSAWRNVQLVFPYPAGGMYYRYNLDGKWSQFRKFAFLDDNVASATKLQNMRKIWGQDFDGAGNVTGALSSVTNINNLLHLAGNNVGIGTNTPVYKLDVNGNMRISDELFVNSFLYLANNKGLCLKDKEGSNQRALFISSSNTVYFGCNDRPLYTLFEGDELQFNVYNKGWQNALVISRDRTAIFTGNVLAQGGVTAYTTSDRRLKENIKAVDSMKIIRSLGGTWQFDYKDTGKHSIGFIAQSVKGSVLRNMVYTDAKGYMKLNYLDTRLIALALGAAVQVDDKVERLKKRIKVLETEIEKLKGN